MRRAQQKAKKVSDDVHIHQAISDLEKQIPDAEGALASLRKVVAGTPPPAKLRKVVSEMLGNVEQSLENQREADQSPVLEMGNMEVTLPEAVSGVLEAVPAIQPRLFHYRVPDEWGYRQMHLVEPPAKDEDGFLATLHNFSSFLRDHYDLWYDFFKACDRWDPQFQNSVRMIDGGRFEFMLSGKRGYSCFLQLVMFMNQTEDYATVDEDGFRVDLLTFARTQMQEDDRTENLDIFQDEGLIVSCRGKNRAQNPHIDLLDPLTLQGGLIVTGGKNIEATYEYEAAEPVVRSMETFLSIYKDIPIGLLRVLNSTGDTVSGKAATKVRYLLEKVGQLLSMNINKLSKQSNNNAIKTGMMFTLPGGVIHGGPKTEGVRAVLFLVASNNTTIDYNPELQYTTTNTWATLAKFVWESLGEHTAPQDGRLYLLRKMKESAKTSSNSSSTVDEVKFKAFLEKVEVVYCPTLSNRGRKVKRPTEQEKRHVEAAMNSLSLDYGQM